MKFLISRTSVDYEEQPHPDARLEEVLQTDIRDLKNHEGFNFSLWLSKGQNHRVTPEGIARDFSVQKWVIEIPDLVAFAKANERIILTAYSADPLPRIEIYDGWRE
jgi:hypothetical protein